MMALNIKDPKTDKLVRQLAAATGEGVTMAVRKAVEEKLQRIPTRIAGQDLAAQILEIAARCSALPDLDARPAEDILGYDENGLPN